MAFTSTITGNSVWGNKRVAYGTYTSADGSTGGDINTSLVLCEHIQLTPNSSSVGTNQSVVNETLPIAGSAVTIVTDANQAGYWLAFGY